MTLRMQYMYLIHSVLHEYLKKPNSTVIYSITFSQADKASLLSVDSINDFGLYSKLIEHRQHLLSTVRPPQQVYHVHLKLEYMVSKSSA